MARIITTPSNTLGIRVRAWYQLVAILPGSSGEPDRLILAAKPRELLSMSLLRCISVNQDTDQRCRTAAGRWLCPYATRHLLHLMQMDSMKLTFLYVVEHLCPSEIMNSFLVADIFAISRAATHGDVAHHLPHTRSGWLLWWRVD